MIQFWRGKASLPRTGVWVPLIVFILFLLAASSYGALLNPLALRGQGNVAGGLEQNAAYFGLLQFGLDIDLEKAVGWKGASFNTTSKGSPSSVILVRMKFAVPFMMPKID